MLEIVRCHLLFPKHLLTAGFVIVLMIIVKTSTILLKPMISKEAYKRFKPDTVVIAPNGMWFRAPNSVQRDAGTGASCESFFLTLSVPVLLLHKDPREISIPALLSRKSAAKQQGM